MSSAHDKSRRVRINAILLGLVALLVYGGFIFINWYRGQ